MNIYKDIYKSTQIGVEAIDSLLPHVKNEELKKELCAERKELADLNQKASESLSYDEVKESGICMTEKGMLKGSIFVKATLGGADDNKVASMLIEGSNMGLNSLQKEINRLKDEGEEIPHIAVDTFAAYNTHIGSLRRFL